MIRTISSRRARPRLSRPGPRPCVSSGLKSMLNLYGNARCNMSINSRFFGSETDAEGESVAESKVSTISSTSSRPPRPLPKRPFLLPYPRYSWNSPKIQKEYMDKLSEYLGLAKTDLSAWYKVSSREVRANGGRELLRRHGESLFSLLKSVYPDHPWEIYKFSKRSKMFWDNADDKRSLVEEILASIGIEVADKEAWYKVSPERFAFKGGKDLLRHYGSSISNMFASLYPDHKWDEEKFLVRTGNPWRSLEYQRRFLSELVSNLGIKEGDYDSYYNLNNLEIIRRGGSGLLGQYNNSIPAALIALYPEHPWDLKEFSRRPKGYWKSSENQRAAVLEIGRQLGIGENEFEKWYKVTTADFRKHKGSGLLFLFNSAISSILLKVFPEHKFDLSKFHTKPQSYWKSVSNQRRFMDELAIEFGFKLGDLAAWYKVGNKEMVRAGAGGLLFNYGTSMSALLKEVYPEHKWDLWRFSKIPKNILNDEKSWHEIIAHVELNRGLKKPEDWAKIATKDLEELGVKYFFDKNGGLLGVLPKRYPEVDWINLLS